MIFDKYRDLKDRLNYETGHFSSISRMVRNPIYQEIIELGSGVVPIILDEFDRYDQTDEVDSFPGSWAFVALSNLTGAEATGTRAGVISDLVKFWIKWGENNGCLAKDRPKHQKRPPIVYKGWIVVARMRGEDYVLRPKVAPSNKFEEEHGTAAWVSKIDAARKVDDGWWKKYAWILPTKQEAETVLDILNEKIKAGECAEGNKPEKAWVEEI